MNDFLTLWEFYDLGGYGSLVLDSFPEMLLGDGLETELLKVFVKREGGFKGFNVQI